MLQLPRQRTVASCLAPIAFAFLCACAGSSNGPEQPVTGAKPGTPEALQSAEQELAAGRAEAALAALDELMEPSEGWDRDARWSFELLRGRANLEFARESIAAQRSGTLIEGTLLDAAAAFENAARLRPAADPLLGLAQAQRLRGDWDQVLAACDEAVLRLGGFEELEGEAGATALRLRAEARLRVLLDERQRDGDELSERLRQSAQQALADCDRLRRIDAEDPAAYVTASYLFRAVGEKPRALDVLQQGVRTAPEAQILHQTLQGTYWGAGSYLECAGFYENLAREQTRPSAMTAWFRGQAELAYADELRRGGAEEAAGRRYERAFAAFADCARLQPDYADSCRLKQAIAQLSRARMQIDAGALAEGEALLDAAFAQSNAIAAEDAQGYLLHRDGLGKDYRGAVSALGAPFFDEAAPRLEEARRFWTKIAERHPSWGFAWNNLGFACRDLGVRVAAAGDEAAAMQLWEESYRAYERAVEHRPNDPRVVNDCGLMLVYHLRRDYARANALFERAIELGTAQLAELPPKADDEAEEIAAQRRDLEEAVGDAWENLAKSHWENGKDAAKARECLQKALRYFPYGERDGVEAQRRVLDAAAADKGTQRLPRSRRAEPVVVALLGATARADDVEDAIAALRAGKSEDALDLVEPLLRKQPEDAELNWVAGAASLLFARQEIAAQSRGANANLIDAVTRLEKAVELARDRKEAGAHVGKALHVLAASDLIQALLLQGETRRAATFADTHAAHVKELESEIPAAAFAQFAARRGEAAARRAIADKQEKAKDAAKSEASAREALELAEKRLAAVPREQRPIEAHPSLQATAMNLARLFTSWKDLELWAGKPAAAIDVLGRGALLANAEQAGMLIGTMPSIVMQNDGLASKALSWGDKALREHDDAPALLWWRGYLHYAAAYVARKSAQLDLVLSECDAAIADYRRVIEREPNYARDTKFRIAETLNTKGAALHAQGKKKEALAAWMEAIELWPDKDNPRDYLSQRTPRDEAFIYAMGFVRQGNELEGARILEEIGKLIPSDWEAFNNAALMLRDLCERQGARRSPGPFMKTLERSYENYTKALRINPGDPRLANDTALIDVYYLKKHTRESEEMLRRGIRYGSEKLQRDPPENQQERRDLEEAVGDCHMNLGLMLMDQPARWSEAKEQLEKSLEFYPGRSRASRHLLTRLERMQEEAKSKKDGGEGEKGEGEKKDEGEKKKGDGGE